MEDLKMGNNNRDIYPRLRKYLSDKAQSILDHKVNCTYGKCSDGNIYKTIPLSIEGTYPLVSSLNEKLSSGEEEIIKMAGYLNRLVDRGVDIKGRLEVLKIEQTQTSINKTFIILAYIAFDSLLSEKDIYKALGMELMIGDPNNFK